jgi:hypothetical protein
VVVSSVEVAAAPIAVLPGVRQPNFFLIGAPRAATTSLWHYLRSHPDIYMPPSLAGKEPSYFCDLTPPWAREYRTFDKYLSLFEGARRHRMIGDASTNYLVAPESAQRIHAQYPDARILVILRNPAERAFSTYRFLVSLGLESATTFEKALAREPRRMADERFKRASELLYHAYLYVHSSLYGEQLERYYRLFPREQIHVVLQSDLKKEPLKTVQSMYEFLGVDPTFEPELAVHNASTFPLSVRFQAFIGQRWHSHPLRPKQPVRRRDRLHYPVAFGINTLLGQYRRVRLNPDTRRALLQRFRSDIDKTSILIGRPLDQWMEERSRATAVADAAVPPVPAGGSR